MSISHSATCQTARWAILSATLFVLLVCLPVRFWIGPIQMTTTRLFLATAALPLMIYWLRQSNLRRDPATWAFAAATLWAGIAISQTSPAHLIENTGALWLEMFCAYLLGRACIQNATDLKRVALVSGLALLVLLPLTVFETQTGAPPLIQALRALPLISSVEIVSIEPRLNLERAQVIFAHPIHFGLFATTCFTLALIGLGTTSSLTLRVTLAGAALLSVFFALSSGPLLALIVQILLLAWVWVWGARAKSWLVLFGLLAVFYVIIDLASDRTPIRVFMSYATFSPHNAFWRGLIFEWGLVNIWNNPIFGLGFNDWERPSFMISGSIDNYWLATAMKYGLPGFVAIALGFAFAIRRAIRAEQGDLKSLRLAWLITMISVILALCTVHVWTAIHTYLFFLLGAGQFNAHSSAIPSPKPAPVTLTFSRDTSGAIYTRGGVTA